MKPTDQICATIYTVTMARVLHEKVCSCYFQALPREGDIITVDGSIQKTYKVLSVHHITSPIASTDSQSYNLNQPRNSEIHLLCSETSL